MNSKARIGAAFFVSTLISAVLVWVTTGTAAGQAPAEGHLILDPGSGKVYAEQLLDSRVIEVKPLDDPANPFREQYDEWDRWIYAHALFMPNPQYWKQETGPVELNPPAVRLHAWVDAEGYLLPALESARRQEVASDQGQLEEVNGRYFSLWGEGEIDAALLAEMDQAVLSVKASFYPSIPAWLGEHPPHNWAQLRPNGEVLTCGELNSFVATDKILKPELPYCRYSATGELLGRIDSASSTLLLFYDAALFGPLPAGDILPWSHGGWRIVDPTTNAVLGKYACDGTPLALDADPPESAGQRFTRLSGRIVQLYYQAQQAGR